MSDSMIDFLPFKAYKRVISALIRPTFIVDSILDIPLEDLKSTGITTLLVDVDNTLLSRSNRSLDLDTLNWIELVRSLGFNIFVVSNNSSRRRILKICKQAQLTGLYFSMKPLPFSINDLLDSETLTQNECIMVGDQVLTDILVANSAGMRSVLVDPLDKKLSFFKTLQREFELLMLRVFN